MLNRGTQKEGRARKEGLLKSYPQSNGLFTYCRVKDGQEINHITNGLIWVSMRATDKDTHNALGLLTDVHLLGKSLCCFLMGK